MKYLSGFFVPQDSVYETNILITLMSFKLISFFSIKTTFIDIFIIKIYALFTHSYTFQKKYKNFFLVI